jgi:purine-binding chemotaxis protein CheW
MSSDPSRGGKFLTFFLGHEEYGIEILRVQEIIGMMPITRVPRTAPHVRGVINLRGKVVQVLDLRARFGMEPTEQSEATCIIVVAAGSSEMGVIVDRVSEVLHIVGDDIEDAPAMGSEAGAQFLLGIGKTADRVRLLLDVDRVLFDREDAVAV